MTAVTAMQNAGNIDLAMAAAEEVLQLVPGAGLLVKAATNLHKQYQLKRLGVFLEAAAIDDSYLVEIADDSATQELFVEFVDKAINTSPPTACVALALIYKDQDIGPSLKSFTASSILGISQGTLNVFLDLMDNIDQGRLRHIEQEGDIISFPTPNTMAKDSRELTGFCNDLVGRGICSKGGGVIGDKGTTLGIGSFTVLLYRKLKQARDFLANKQA